MDKEKFVLSNYLHIKSYADENDSEGVETVITVKHIREFMELLKINLIKLKHDEYNYKNISEIIDKLAGERLNGTIV